MFQVTFAFTCLVVSVLLLWCVFSVHPHFLMVFALLQKGTSYEAEPRMSFLEGARDVAVLEAMLESGTKQGAPVQVKKF